MTAIKPVRKKRATSRRLVRGTDRVIAGVCSGIAEHFNTDPAAIRVLWALLTVFTAIVPGTIAYIVCWVVFPKQ